jgi:acetoin utilization deacetylase AcuC-like enzyme
VDTVLAMAPPPVFLEHYSSVQHDTGPHPERAERIVMIEEELERHQFFGFERMQSPAAAREVVEAVHPAPYVASIEAAAARGGAQLDLDTVVSEHSFDAAMHAAGGAVALVDLLLDGSAPTGFSSHRPPGHHALRSRAMGFCLFNNVAVAAQYALEARGLERVLIVDWDVHHGNGTNDIFHTSEQVLFVSIHQSPLYPGTGSARDTGSEAGQGYSVNLPVPPGSDDALYGSLTDHVIVPLAAAFEPQLVLISAGYDAHREDPLAEVHLTEAGFVTMTRSLRRVAATLGAPLGCVLEGGYAVSALARSVAATLQELAAPLPGADGGSEFAVAPQSRAARERLASWWPALSGRAATG